MTCSPADAQVSLRGNAAEASEISFIRLGYVCLPCKKKPVLFSVSFRGTRTSFLPFLFNQIHQHTHTHTVSHYNYTSGTFFLPHFLFLQKQAGSRMFVIIAYVTTPGEPVISTALDPSADSYYNLSPKSHECSLV